MTPPAAAVTGVASGVVAGAAADERDPGEPGLGVPDLGEPDPGVSELDGAELNSAESDGTELDGTELDGTASGFSVTLRNFSGPFDLLLSLIARRRMDITEVALAEVTDEFIAYIATLRQRRDAQEPGDRQSDDGDDGGPDLAALDQSSAFLVVASTLLDLKTARLLPAGTTDAEEDVALLEARDLLFARLLQYKAFRDVSALMRERMQAESRRFPRQTTLDPRFASVLPELVWTLSPEQFGALAEDVLSRTPTEPDAVGLGHLHAPPVSVREQAGILAARLQSSGRLTFRELVHDAATTLVVVARFLSLLELFRDRAITFRQDEPLGELVVLWDPDTPDELPDSGAEWDEAQAEEQDVVQFEAHGAERHEAQDRQPGHA